MAQSEININFKDFILVQGLLQILIKCLLNRCIEHDFFIIIFTSCRMISTSPFIFSVFLKTTYLQSFQGKNISEELMTNVTHSTLICTVLIQ